MVVNTACAGMLVRVVLLLTVCLGTCGGTGEDRWVQSDTPAAQPTPVAVVQGMDFAWRRHIVGFETPHRMGNLQWTAEASECSKATNQSTIHSTMTFTPGVDGDYAFPKVRYAVVEGDAGLIETTQVSVAATDKITKASRASDAPSARVTMLQNVTLPGSGERAALLGGITLHVHCVKDTASGCDICNSNGAWFTVFSVRLQDCTHGNACRLNATLERGWTPSHGGGKPLSTCLSYNLTAQVVSAAKHAVDTHTYRHTASLFETPANVTTPVHLPVSHLPRMLSGVRGVSFNLTASAKHPQRGRYIERFTFGVTQPRLADTGMADGGGGAAAAAADKRIVYDVSCAIQSPAVTTYPSNVTYHLESAVVVLPKTMPTAATAGTITASRHTGRTTTRVTNISRVACGVVCEDDDPTGFHCSKHNFPQHLTTHVRDTYTCHSS